MTNEAQAPSSGVVLIVEDDTLLRLAIASSLRQNGFEVLEAANAAEAVTILNSVAVDALISDINMPGNMDGLSLARWVHRHQLDTKIILTSASSQSLGEAEQYVSFLAKPYDGEDIQQLLRQVLWH